MAKAPTIKNWNPKLPVMIQADSSKYGLGCCLLQEGRPVAFASRSLTAAEVNYSQVEKELLAIIFATKKFHLYIYGQQVEVKTDHKPLVSLMKKEIHKIISTRLQRMRLKLLIYDLIVEYLPGKKMFVADLLSRNFQQTKQKEDGTMTEMVHMITIDLQITEQKKQEFRDKTAEDVSLRKVMEYLKEGWPKRTKALNMELKKYQKLKNELTITDGLIFLGEKLVVPGELRKQMLQLLHNSHFGIDKTKKKARQIMYWPGMSTEIKQLIKNCTVCGRYARKNRKERLIRHELPELPFETLGVDICEYGGKEYLVAACYLTKWLEIRKLGDKTAGSVIEELKEVFTSHGVPKKIVADNMPFNSKAFLGYAREWDIKVVTSSPRYPQSNGLAEKMVGLAKGMLKKAHRNGQDYREMLLEYRNTPLIGLEVSPSQLLMSRRLRTRIPVSTKLLEPVVQTNYRKTMVELRNKQTEYYNRGATNRPEMNPGQNLWYQEGRVWEPAQLLQKYKTPRSYIVRNQAGQELRRNKVHLKETTIPFQLKSAEDDHLEEELRVESEAMRNATVKLEPTNSYTTRSGRQSKKPDKYKDFV